MSDHTRADEGEGREPDRPTCVCGKVAFPDKIERAWSCPCGESAAWQHGDLSAAAHADALRRAPRAEARVAQAEAEVARLTAENERLRIAFHDATRRPLGVTPDSGEEFYDQRMADEAEERRVARSRQMVLRGLSREEAEARAAALGDAQRREHAARTALEAPHADK